MPPAAREAAIERASRSLPLVDGHVTRSLGQRMRGRIERLVGHPA
jgi:hypothetical protein